MTVTAPEAVTTLMGKMTGAAKEGEEVLPKVNHVSVEAWNTAKAVPMPEVEAVPPFTPLSVTPEAAVTVTRPAPVCSTMIKLLTGMACDAWVASVRAWEEAFEQFCRVFASDGMKVLLVPDTETTKGGADWAAVKTLALARLISTSGVVVGLVTTNVPLVLVTVLTLPKVSVVSTSV